MMRRRAGPTLGGIAEGVATLPALGVISEEPLNPVAWEVRPGGMLVQKRDPGEDSNPGPLIRLRISHGLSLHNVSVPFQSSFGDLKKLLAKETGLHPTEQRLLYRGKERDNSDYFNEAGVKDKSKLVLVEDPTAREKRLLEMRKDAENARASKAVVEVKEEVNKLAKQVAKVESVVVSGIKVTESDIVVVTEKLMCQLLKLDALKANGDVKAQRLVQIRRVQKYVEALDSLKERNALLKPKNAAVAKPASTVVPKKPTSRTVVTTKWETFDNGSNIFTPPQTSSSASALMTDWERFD